MVDHLLYFPGTFGLGEEVYPSSLNPSPLLDGENSFIDPFTLSTPSFLYANVGGQF